MGSSSNSNQYNLEHYGGSTALSFLCELTTLSIDQINFISCQLFALLLSFILKKWIQNPLTRLWYTLVSGLSICIFCFGTQIFHIIISAGLSYLVIRNTKSRMMPWIVLVAAMCYLSFLHIKRQFFDHTGYSLDITGPLMVLTQKVTSLAFSIRDGVDQKKEDDKSKAMTQIQNRYVVPNIPDELEFCSYVFQFQSMLAGPLVFYRDFIDFIKINDSNVPSPFSVVAMKLGYSIFFAILFIKVGPHFDCNIVRDTEFLDNTSGIYKMFYLTLATTLERCKYYHAWILADAVCNMSGLGYDSSKKTWDMVSNVDAFSFEIGSNLKTSLELWNIGTMKWLRHVVYERTPPHLRTGAVYMVSAFWHGFYPGYYITFLSGALFTFAGRDMRRYLRPFFLGGRKTKMAYDVSTIVMTRLVLTYVTFAFVVQDFFPSVALYVRVYFFLHILTVFAMLIVPSVSKRLQHLKPTSAVPATSEKSLEGHSKSNGNGAVISNGNGIKTYSSEPTMISEALYDISAVKPRLTVPENENGISKKLLVPVNAVNPSPRRNDSESENEESQNNVNEEIWKNLVINSTVNLSPLTTSAKLKTGDPDRKTFYSLIEES